MCNGIRLFINKCYFSADSGISDTEDEDKPHLAKQQQQESEADIATAAVFVEQSKEEASTNGQQVAESPIAMEIEAGAEPVPETAAVSSEVTPTEEVKPSSPAAAPSEPEHIATLTQVVSTVQQPEEPALATSPLAQAQEKTTVAVEVVESTPTTENETVPSESPTTDKKRPLEREENDEGDGDVEHSPDAKQPRIFSPDKVIII